MLDANGTDDDLIAEECENDNYKLNEDDNVNEIAEGVLTKANEDSSSSTKKKYTSCTINTLCCQLLQ